MTTNKSEQIRYGSVEISEDEVALKGAKIRVTMMIDYDLVKSYKEIASKTGAKYQTLMNQKLREGLRKSQESDSLASRVQRLERHVFKGKKKKTDT